MNNMQIVMQFQSWLESISTAEAGAIIDRLSDIEEEILQIRHDVYRDGQWKSIQHDISVLETMSSIEREELLGM